MRPVKFPCFCKQASNRSWLFFEVSVKNKHSRSLRPPLAAIWPLADPRPSCQCTRKTGTSTAAIFGHQDYLGELEL